ncbi:hypothetical protein PROFUN_15015 [Planoprotostelium fungivorum]|uniref:Uncharacterized protein n=1 Tax=Planoprotostelium fungivorum TaxID=1890364 RepID=A0A2P6MY20_9EUKA|nr:hypothetical protein PROFUN_15015 [Planoprotostelium fungivorum]
MIARFLSDCVLISNCSPPTPLIESHLGRDFFEPTAVLSPFPKLEVHRKYEQQPRVFSLPGTGMDLRYGSGPSLASIPLQAQFRGGAKLGEGVLPAQEGAHKR